MSTENHARRVKHSAPEYAALFAGRSLLGPHGAPSGPTSRWDPCGQQRDGRDAAPSVAQPDVICLACGGNNTPTDGQS